eukprot:CAMPEP_0206215148 /NCGR_PEP_ID=MMETSP0047_2-20121206/2039_1 /ASSEMBLY_ACC=CAM_ASM_000192 /TAXON_ID=195065 /ORGANISM="Chroomonas mesostigmatica_cf, Strain CCMP1168" /LENGTH=137 /DNA_ID=CAMNT_0053637421 /DNA_START=147 /DNA_END=560 /DNA_ORIENTATION=-
MDEILLDFAQLVMGRILAALLADAHHEMKATKTLASRIKAQKGLGPLRGRNTKCFTLVQPESIKRIKQREEQQHTEGSMAKTPCSGGDFGVREGNISLIPSAPCFCSPSRSGGLIKQREEQQHAAGESSMSQDLMQH